MTATQQDVDRRLRQFTARVRGYAILTLDADGLVYTWNEGAHLVKGYEPAEIVGQPYERFFPAEDVAAGHPEAILTAAREQGQHEEEGWRVRKDGSRFWAHVLITRIDAEDGSLLGYGTITEDLTERRAHEQALQEQVDELEQFAYVTSHDLSEPLRSIAGYADVLRRRYGHELDADGQHYLEKIVTSSARMRSLIDDLLAYSRAGRRELDLVDLPLRDVVDEALAALPVAREAVTVDPLPRGRCDRTLMTELLRNLISNAVKFSAGPPEVTIAGTEHAGGVELSVADRGVGIPEEYGERVFDLFQRLHAREQYEGTGVGLAISRRIAERHGGTLTASPRDGGGTVFRLTLPA